MELQECACVGGAKSVELNTVWTVYHIGRIITYVIDDGQFMQVRATLKKDRNSILAAEVDRYHKVLGAVTFHMDGEGGCL